MYEVPLKPNDSYVLRVRVVAPHILIFILLIHAQVSAYVFMNMWTVIQERQSIASPFTVFLWPPQCPSWTFVLTFIAYARVCVCLCTHSRPPSFTFDLSLCPAEPRATARQRLWPHPERRRPYADVWRHGHNRQRSVVFIRPRGIGGELGRQRQTQRQHVGGRSRARTGRARTRVPEPRHASRLPHRGPRLTPPPLAYRTFPHALHTFTFVAHFSSETPSLQWIMTGGDSVKE